MSLSSPDSALRCFQELARCTKNLGLAVQPDKSEILLPPSQDHLIPRLEELRLRVVRGALPLLGTVVGNDAPSLKRWMQDKIDAWKLTLPLLARKELPAQLSLLLARWSMTAKPNFLARSLPPHLTQPYLAEKMKR